METLDRKIEALKLEHSHKSAMAELLSDFKHMAYGTTDKTVNLDLNSLTEFNLIKELLPPTETTTLLGDINKTVLNTPYRIGITNPASPNQYNEFKCTIHYKSNDISVRLTVPISEVKDYTRTNERGITDSEHHYFVGVDYKKLHAMKVRCYEFTSSQVNWYGGDKTLTDLEVIKAITQ